MLLPICIFPSLTRFKHELLILVPRSITEHPNFVQVKVHKYLSFFLFLKIRAGKSVKQVNKFELPYTIIMQTLLDPLRNNKMPLVTTVGKVKIL